MKIKNIFQLFVPLLLVTFCKCSPDSLDLSLDEALKPSDSLPKVTVTTDKAMYAPGEEVRFTANSKTDGLGVRYWHLGDVISEEVLSGTEWSWNPPADDFKGYYAEIVGKDRSGRLCTVGSVAVDVSSTWTKFPRYGYLGRFDNCPKVKRASVLSDLNRHHINGIQYYEWAYDHHHPLCGTPENPGMVWDKYMTGSKCEYDVIKGYIDEAHDLNMASMFYNLNNGAFEWAAEDGVSEEWYTFRDKTHTRKDYHELPVPPFRSSLYLTDPSSDGWLDYMSKQTSDVYKVFDFDGFHIDQLGDRSYAGEDGHIYDYWGNPVDLRPGYEKFINKMKESEPDKLLVFNAVSGWGQENIAASPVSFLYTEVWDHNFNALKNTLETNRSIAPKLNNVITAYIHSTNSGYFNTPAVLLLDAVIFAMGGSHLELGENLISDIYWPGCSLKLKPELKTALVEYYDFLTGYENLLRDDVRSCKINVTSDDVALGMWDGIQGKVNVWATQKPGKMMFHLLNFSNAVHMDWHDGGRTQTEPELLSDFEISFPLTKTVRKVWAASPDFSDGVPSELEHRISEDGIKLIVKVPALKYWTMVVVE